MLIEKTLFGIENKIEDSIQMLKDMEPNEGYYLAFSGGKDSICIKYLADLAGVKYDAHYNVTTIDPPELVYFIRDFHPDVKFEYPKEAFLHLMAKKGFPQRQNRWCCSVYKEGGGANRHVITGVRRAESAKRSKRKAVEHCYKSAGKIYINPIINWSDSDVWEFIGINNISYCSLYDEGYKRLGCLLCPMAAKTYRDMDIERYSNYVKHFIKAFEALYKYRKDLGKISINRWENGEEMFWWWMRENRTSEDPDQGVMFE